MSIITQVFAVTDVGGTAWANLTSTGGTMNITGGTALNFESVVPASSCAFLAYLGSAVSNVTGAGSAFTLGSGTALTEVYDRGNCFNTNGTMTAPSNGKYFLAANVSLSGVTALMTAGTIDIVTNDFTYRYSINPASGLIPSGAITFPVSVVANMDANDTATIVVTISNGLSDAADIAGGVPLVTYFYGYKLI